MSDDRLFASNNPIGRKWYVLNTIVLAVIVVVTNFVFKEYIYPFVTSEAYLQISKFIHFVLYIIYLVTLFALIERRLYDVSGTRSTNFYKYVSMTMTTSIIVQAVVILYQYKHIPIPLTESTIYGAGIIALLVFLFIAFVLAFLKGKISNLTYEEYRKKIKYE